MHMPIQITIPVLESNKSYSVSVTATPAIRNVTEAVCMQMLNDKLFVSMEDVIRYCTVNCYFIYT